MLDLDSGMNISQIQHDSKIDWLELSDHADKLLMRDKKLRVHLVLICSGSYEKHYWYFYPQAFRI